MLERVGLADRRDYLPTQLSGGQQQRVAANRIGRGTLTRKNPTAVTAQGSIVRFTWSGAEGAAEFCWQIIDSDGNLISVGTLAEAMLELIAGDYIPCRFTLIVQAQLNGQTLEDRLTFEITQEGQPGDGPEAGMRPGGFGSFSGSGGRTGGGAGFDGMPEEEQGFRIVPGVALTDSHVSGTKDMTAYGAVALEVPENAMTRLELGGTELDVSLADSGSFAAEIRRSTLTLLPQEAEAEWLVNAHALDTLRQSGIDALDLWFGGSSVRIPTDLEFSGAIYAGYRTQGYVSKDFELHYSASGAAVTVAGHTVTVAAASGGTVSEVCAQPGDVVAEGDALANLRTRKVFAEKDGTVARILAAEGTAVDGQVLELSPVSRCTIYCTVDSAYQSASSTLVHAGEALYETADGKETELAAPTSGIVTQDAAQGETLRKDQTAFAIAPIDQIQVEIQVDESTASSSSRAIPRRSSTPMIPRKTPSPAQSWPSPASPKTASTRCASSRKLRPRDWD